MADASTVQLSEAHAPKPAALEAFKSTWHDIKDAFHKSRKRWDEHEPEMFARVKGFTDHELLEGVDLDKDLLEVRTGESAYGLHLFGKIKIQKVNDAYIHVRLFVKDDASKFHAIHTEEKPDKSFNAVFHKSDPLEWFSE